ncbi:MAG: CHASE2 domain-containing protein [bacterium]|nr:CHASE2 domain-containing protein [bacterium]
MPAHKLVQNFQDVALQGNLESFFSGKFVFIADIARGADIGQTPLEQNVPLVSTHAAMLSGLLTNNFYRQWPVSYVIALICALAAFLTFAALLRSSRLFYAAGGIFLIGISGSVWIQFFRFILFPAVTVGGSLLLLFVGLGIGVEVSKHAFILGAFSHYVPKGVVKELLKHPEALTLGGEKRTVTMLFSDVRGFTTISEGMAPEELVALLNEYLTEMTAIVLDAGGIIDKYEGDAIMAEFGAPLPLPDHADRAVAAALAMQRRLRELRERWAERNLPELSCRIGINSGEVVLGNMGSDQMFDYTVMGDDVNLASRLEGANKNYNTFLMISEASYMALTPGRFRTRALDLIKVKGKTRAVKVFEVYGEVSDEIDPETLGYYQSYQTGFEAYLKHDFTRALTLFASALELRPNDPASKWLISRIVELNPDELPQDWDGSVELTSK